MSIFASEMINDEFIHIVIRTKLVRRYNKYYVYWKDFTILTAFLSLIGLLVTFVSWSKSFEG
jgi:hypothetical protein